MPLLGVFRTPDRRWRVEVWSGDIRIYDHGMLVADRLAGAVRVEQRLRELGAPPWGQFVED